MLLCTNSTAARKHPKRQRSSTSRVFLSVEKTRELANTLLIAWLPDAQNSKHEWSTKINAVEHVKCDCTISKHMKEQSSVDVSTPLSSCLTSSGIPFWQYNLALKKEIPVSHHLTRWTHYAHAGQHSPSCRMGVAHAAWGHFSVVHVTCFSCVIKQENTFKIIDSTVDVAPDGYHHSDNKGASRRFR